LNHLLFVLHGQGNPMLQGPLSSLRGFSDADRAGKVSNYREAEPLRFVDEALQTSFYLDSESQ